MKKTSQIIISVLIIGIVIGFAIGSITMVRRAVCKKVYSEYQEKITEISEPEEIFQFSGKIKEIKNKTLVLEAYSCDSYEDGRMKTEIKLVRLTDSIQIIEKIKKSPEELSKELETYRKALEEISEGEVLPTMPLDYRIVAASFSNVKVGKYASAEAEENIKNKEEFIAKKITLY